MEKYVHNKVHRESTVYRFYPDGNVKYIRQDEAWVCGYCGSLSPKDALNRLKDPTCNASGSDWKYGWPHKFYIHVGKHFGKFYSMHLYDADTETFNRLTEILETKLGILFFIDEKGMKYSAPYKGFQTWFPDTTGQAPKVPERKLDG